MADNGNDVLNEEQGQLVQVPRDPHNILQVRVRILDTLRQYYNDIVNRRPFTFGALVSSNQRQRILLLLIYAMLKKFLEKMRNYDDMQTLKFRELFYFLVAEFPGLIFDYDTVFRCVTIICNEYHCSRNSLPIETQRTGVFLLTNGTQLQSVRRGQQPETVGGIEPHRLMLIPSMREMQRWLTVKTTAKFLLLFESGAQCNKYLNDGLLAMLDKGVIAIYGGMPTYSLRYFSKFFELVAPNPIPIFSLFDLDGGGINLSSLTKFGPYGEGRILNMEPFILHSLTPIFVDNEIHLGNGLPLASWDRTAFGMIRRRTTLEHMSADDQDTYRESAEIFIQMIEHPILQRRVYPYSTWRDIDEFLRHHPTFGPHFLALE